MGSRAKSHCRRPPHLLILALSCSLVCGMLSKPALARSAAPAAWLVSCRIPVFERIGRTGGVALRPLPSQSLRHGTSFAGRACATWPGVPLFSSAWLPSGRRGLATGAKKKAAPGPTDAAVAEAHGADEGEDGQHGQAALAPRMPKKKQTTEEINEFWEKCMEQVLAPWAG